jgi:hypothetical protein
VIRSRHHLVASRSDRGVTLGDAPNREASCRIGRPPIHVLVAEKTREKFKRRRATQHLAMISNRRTDHRRQLDQVRKPGTRFCIPSRAQTRKQEGWFEDSCIILSIGDNGFAEGRDRTEDLSEHQFRGRREDFRLVTGTTTSTPTTCFALTRCRMSRRISRPQVEPNGVVFADQPARRHCQP